MYIESVLQEEISLCLMLRSSRTEPPAFAAALAATDAAIAQLVCPPPPADPHVLTEDILSHLIVPAPHESKELITTAISIALSQLVNISFALI